MSTLLYWLIDKSENENKEENMIADDGSVTLKKLKNEVRNKSDYKSEIVDNVIDLFLKELRDSIINNERVILREYFAFRHKWINEKTASNFGKEKKIVPAHMMIKLNPSRDKVLKPMNDLYKSGEKTPPNSLYDIPLKDFK